MTRCLLLVALCSFSIACSGSDEDGAGPGSGGGGSGGATGGGTGGTGGTGASSTGGAGGSGATGGSGTGGQPATGDRYVATDGSDTGDCSVDPCLTFAYAGQQMQSGEVLVVKDGTYPDAIDASTFPGGSAAAFTLIRAEHDDAVTVTGNLNLYQNADFFLELRGIRFEGPDTKGVAGGNVRFVQSTFVGGPATGNTVSFGVGTNDFQPGAWNVSCEDCIFHGLGGRYAVLVYRAENVQLIRAVARKDGGWGIGSSNATESEPEGVITFYESANSSCEKCVALDSLKLSHSSSEGLGALIQNSHTDQHTNVNFTECFAVANAYSGFAFEGNGSVGTAAVSDSHSVQNSGNGFTANVDGNLTLTRIASIDNGGTGVASYGGASVTLSDSSVSGNGSGALDGVNGSTTGAGPASIDLTGFDSARIRAELCTRAGVTRGLCASDVTFQAYLESFTGP